MADSIKFTDKYIDTTGVYDSTLNKTQQVINSRIVTVDTSSSSIGVPNPVNADTLGGYTADTFLRQAQLINNFTVTTPGQFALDAAAGKTLNDSLSFLTASDNGSITASGTINFTVNDGKYARSGAMVTCSVRGVFTGSTQTGTEFPLARLPYTPITSGSTMLGASFITIGNSTYASGVMFVASGNVYYAREGVQNTLTSNTPIHMMFTYITDGTAN